MKFLCVECDEAMKLQRTAGPDKGSMTVVFACPSCGRQVAMLTNAMETQMVRSLGVKIGADGGGKSAPMETLRGSLVGAALESMGEERAELARRSGSEAGDNDADYGRRPGAPHADGGGRNEVSDGGAGVAASDGGKCPFTHVVSEAFVRERAPDRELVWTADALERLERIPEFVRPMVQEGILEYAREKGVVEIDGAVMHEARERFGM